MKKKITLKTNNHPGILMLISGLLARRGFKIETFQYVSQKNNIAKISITINFNSNFQQIIKQLKKLYDIKMITY